MQYPLDVARRLELYSVPEPNSGCTLWFGSSDQHGYGQLRIGGRPENGGKLVKAHRLAYELEYGPIPAGLCILHKCDVPACVNPKHLTVGTLAENSADMVRKKRHAHGSKAPYSKFAGNRMLVEEVLSLYRTGKLSQKELASRFGVSQATISRFCGKLFYGNQYCRKTLS